LQALFHHLHGILGMTREMQQLEIFFSNYQALTNRRNEWWPALAQIIRAPDILQQEILREGENHANGYDFREAMHAKRYHSHFSISLPFLHEKLLSAILRQHGVVLERKEKTQT
jgi:hypothetical protein